MHNIRCKTGSKPIWADGVENWVNDKRSQRQCSDQVGDTCGKVLGLVFINHFVIWEKGKMLIKRIDEFVLANIVNVRKKWQRTDAIKNHGKKQKNYR